jgi:hypothetical protein
MQARHREVMADLCQRARRLPPGIDDRVALEAGGQAREDYLAVRDLVGFAGRLRTALADLDAPPTALPDGLERCLMFEKSGRLYRDGWLARTGDTRHGALGTFPFYLAYCREIPDDQWWLPTTAGVQQRAEEIRRERREQAAAGMLGVR